MGVDHGNMVQNAQVPGTGKDAPGKKCEKSQMGAVNTACCGVVLDLCLWYWGSAHELSREVRQVRVGKILLWRPLESRRETWN